jgi:hypothetical protein
MTDVYGSGTTQEEIDQAEARLAQMMGTDSLSSSSSSSLSARNSDLDARKLNFGKLFKGLAGTIVSVGGPILGQILSGAGNQQTQVAATGTQVAAEATPVAGETEAAATPLAEETQAAADTAVGEAEVDTSVEKRPIADLD